jgi:hypothetical protein
MVEAEALAAVLMRQMVAQVPSELFFLHLAAVQLQDPDRHRQAVMVAVVDLPHKRESPLAQDLTEVQVRLQMLAAAVAAAEAP